MAHLQHLNTSPDGVEGFRARRTEATGGSEKTPLLSQYSARLYMPQVRDQPVRPVPRGSIMPPTLPFWYRLKMLCGGLFGIPMGAEGRGLYDILPSQRKTSVDKVRNDFLSVDRRKDSDATRRSSTCTNVDDVSGQNEIALLRQAISEFRQRVRLLRLFVFALFVALYLTSLTFTNDSELTSPVVEQARMRLFPEAEESIEHMITQQFTKSLTEFMPGPDVAHVLNSWVKTTAVFCNCSALQAHLTLRVSMLVVVRPFAHSGFETLRGGCCG